MLTDQTRIEGLLADLSDDGWSALKVVFYGGAQGITVELCHQIVNLLSGRRRKGPAQAIEELLSHGLIVSRFQNYRQVFYIPEDLQGILRSTLSRQIQGRICLEASAVVQPTEPQRDLMEDLHRFLAFAARTEITLTHQGQIFKRHLRALLQLLSGDPDAEESLAGGRYPEPLGLFMGYAIDRHLIIRQDEHLVAAVGLTEWVERSTGIKRRDLFHYWRDRYDYQDLQTFLAVTTLVGNRWVSVSRLAKELEPLINPSQRSSFLFRLRHHLCTFLAPIGLFELGTAGGEEDQGVCRLTPSGLAILENREIPPEVKDYHEAFLVQATFEILATRPTLGQVLWNLERMADLSQQTDRTLTYRLSRQSVYRALKAGVTGRELLEFLRQHSAASIPQNVEFDLSAWALSYGQVYLQSLMLLRCATPQLAEQVKASRRTAHFIVGELGAADLIVADEQYKELLEALEADGLMPRPTVERPGAIRKEQDA